MKDGLVRYLPILLLVLAWEATTRLGLVSTTMLPTADQVATAWIRLVADGDLISNGLDSLYRLAAGLGIAIVIGSICGIFMAWSRPVNVVVSPLVELFYPLPKSALIPVTALWLGMGNGSKIALVALGCMLPVVIGAFNGARGTEPVLLWSARSMGASRLQTLWDIVVPSMMPDLLDSIRTALALSFVLMVSCELIVSRSGLGYLIGLLGNGGLYSAMFAAVLTVAFLGFVCDRAYLMLVHRVLAWRQ